MWNHIFDEYSHYKFKIFLRYIYSENCDPEMPTEREVPYCNYTWHGISHNHPQTRQYSKFLTPFPDDSVRNRQTDRQTDRQKDTLRYHKPVLYFNFSAEYRHIPVHCPSALPPDISNGLLHQPPEGYIDRPLAENHEFSRVARASQFPQ